MFDFLLKPKTLRDAVYTQRWAWLVRAGTDLGTITTWDPKLNRNRRVLVPIDVQAFVVKEDSAENIVPVTGGAGDPEPFAEGTTPEPGIHLHWAMPDALLRSKEAEAGGELEMPDLPDRWVVVRALFPVGINRPMLRGWVIDARKGSVTPLDGFDGTTAPSDELPELENLNGTEGGSPMWTASYTASAGRFGFRDQLEDLAELSKVAENGFASNVATYVVAGWSSDIENDPLNVRGKDELFDLLGEMGWYLDPEADEAFLAPDLPVLTRLETVGKFARPVESPPTEIVAKGRSETFKYADIAPTSSLPVDSPARVIMTQRPPRFASMLHGMITGVPIGDVPTGVDERPQTSALSVAIGYDTDDVVTALGASTLGSSTTQRRASEMIAAAFTSDMLDRLGSPDGMLDIAEHEHADTFWSLPGKPLSAARPDHLRVEDSAPTNPTSVGRKERTAASQVRESLNPKAVWRRDKLFFRDRGAPKATSDIVDTENDTTRPKEGDRRTVERPAPRIFRPQAPVVAIKGARPSLRHHYDGLFDDEGRLRCRYPSEAVKSIKGVVEVVDLVPTLGSGALPEEVLTVVREAMVLNPYCSRWLADAAKTGEDTFDKYHTRIQAEMLRMFSPDGRYDGTGEYTMSTAPVSIRGRTPRAVSGDNWESRSAYDSIVSRQVAAELSRASYIVGTSPSPLGVTAWRQPWVPLWLEWRVELTGSDNLDDWDLGDLDFVRKEGSGTNNISLTYDGRSPIGRGLATALHASIERWIAAEQERDATEALLDDSEQDDLESLANFLEPLDLASASLDGIREQLLGIKYVGGIHTDKEEDDDRPVAIDEPTPMFGGKLRLIQMRLVDAFGRTLDVPVSGALTTTTLEVEGEDATIQLTPRIQHGARWLLRLVDPAYKGDPVFAPEAFVNQLEPHLAVNPVAGFLLPDHIDESLEMFDVDGNPIGELSHNEITGAVRWEPAPGRPVPPGAGPMLDLTPGAIPLGEIASGIVRMDVRERASEIPSIDSSLTSVLRAIDTTLWTIDTYGTLGSSSVAGLIGRPIAVVKATLRLDVPDDLDEVRVTAESGEDGRRAAFETLRDQSFPVRLGDLHRSDDSLLGFYIDDDYDHFHIVDKVVAANARDSGRHRGHLGLLGKVSVPAIVPLSHPMLVSEDTIYVRPGQILRLTLLMLPAGRVHLTSGVLPRKDLSLNNAWVSSGLQRVIPSVRLGPVLVDPEEIRLPKVSLLGDKQQFTRRTGPLTWRDDPIVAATQSALLPRMPHEIQEGWVRIIEEEVDG